MNIEDSKTLPLVPLKVVNDQNGQVMGVTRTVEHQDAANKRIRYLLECDAAVVRFLSCEPLLAAWLGQ